jgi:ferredoxin
LTELASTRHDQLSICSPNSRRRNCLAIEIGGEKGIPMPKLKVEGFGEFDVPAGKRLVLALEQDAGVDQLHACGGNARCTTCKVEFIAGEPERMTEAEKIVLAARGLSGVRLSCQIACDLDMTVRAISRFEGSGRKDVGGPPAAEIQPPPVWTERQ